MGFRVSGGWSYGQLAFAGKISGRIAVSVRPQATQLRRSPAAAGTLSFADPAYSGIEGSIVQFAVVRTNGASGAIAVDWSLSGLNEGTPNPASGTIAWNSAEAGAKFVSLQLGIVASPRSGVITLSNPRSLSGGAAPIVVGTTAAMSIQDDLSAPSEPTLGTPTVQSSSQMTIPLASSSTDAQSGILDHSLERAQGAGSADFQQVAQGANIFPFVASGLTPATLYRWRTRGRNRAGLYSIYSNIIEATTLSSLLVPTHYVSAAATNGTGTFANPFSLAQACALAQPGWVVECAPGTYTGPNRNTRNNGSFCIATPGTPSQPIIFYARNFAALQTANLSILQHNGTTQGLGCPVLQALSHHHWYGFYISEDQAPTRPDTGPVVCYNSQGAKFAYMRIDRGSGFWNVRENNRGAIRFEGDGCRGNTVSDCLIENYHGGFVDASGTVVNAAGSEQGIQIYGPVTMNAQNAVGAFVFENNVFRNCQMAVTSKSINTRLIEGGIIVRRNIIVPSNFSSNGDLQSGAVNFIEMGSALGRTQVYQNITIGGAVLVKVSRHAGYGAKDIDVFNNTCIQLTRNQEFNGFLSSSGDGGNANSTGWRVHNNVKTGTAVARIFRYDEGDSALLSMSHNFSNGSFNGHWAEHPDVPGRGSLLTLAQWVASTDWDDSSSTADPLLLSTELGNANLGKLAGSSPARLWGIDLLNLRNLGVSAPINAGAFITADMSDQIGIRPLV
jgi:hypothetical protein